MAYPVYLFASTFYFSFFIFVSAIVQRCVDPTLDPNAKDLSKLAAIVLVGQVGWTIVIVLVTVTGTWIINVPKLKLSTDWVFAVPVIAHILAISAVCCTEFAKYRDDPREALIITSLVSLVSSGIFLNRSAADGGAGTAKVISTAAFVSAVSCFTTPSFPVEGAKKYLNFFFLTCTGFLGLTYLLISPEDPLISLVVEDDDAIPLVREREISPLVREDTKKPRRGGTSKMR